MAYDADTNLSGRGIMPIKVLEWLQANPFTETVMVPIGGQHLLRMQNGATGPFNLPASEWKACLLLNDPYWNDFFFFLESHCFDFIVKESHLLLRALVSWSLLHPLWGHLREQGPPFLYPEQHFLVHKEEKTNPTEAWKEHAGMPECGDKLVTEPCWR